MNQQKGLHNDHSLQIKKSIVQLLIGHDKIIFFANTINAITFVLISWSKLPHYELSLWLSLVLCINFGRFYIVNSTLVKSKNLTRTSCRRILLVFCSGSLLSGLLWGYLGCTFLMADSPYHLAFSIFILAGMTAGIVGTHSIYPPIVYLFTTTSLVPTSLTLLVSDRLELQLIGAMSLIYTFVMVRTSFYINKKLMETLNLSLENESLTDRLNCASHEIKTPIAAIVGFSEILMKDEINHDEQKEYLKIIMRNGEQLKEIVETILSYSENDHDSLESKELFVIDEEFEKIISTFKKDLTAKNISTSLNFKSNIPNKIYCNTKKVRQVLTNLYSNAIKYTERGSIHIDISLDAHTKKMTINIQDTGIGMGEKAIENIFTPFYREERPEVRLKEGSGLGLGLSKKFARSLGGDLKLIDTEVNKGTTFSFSFEVEYPEINQIYSSEYLCRKNESLKGLHIALVEDSRDIQELFKTLLERNGAKVQLCNNGREILNLFLKKKHFDLILMDIQMPQMNGIKTTQELRLRGCSTPIIALSAKHIEEMHSDDVYSQFNNYITKSTKLKHIIHIINKTIENENQIKKIKSSFLPKPTLFLSSYLSRK